VANHLVDGPLSEFVRATALGEFMVVQGTWVGVVFHVHPVHFFVYVIGFDTRLNLSVAGVQNLPAERTNLANLFDVLFFPDRYYSLHVRLLLFLWESCEGPIRTRDSLILLVELRF